MGNLSKGLCLNENLNKWPQDIVTELLDAGIRSNSKDQAFVMEIMYEGISFQRGTFEPSEEEADRASLIHKLVILIKEFCEDPVYGGGKGRATLNSLRNLAE
eukprot:gnl/MRDRNA2_/MRDRNA2_352687_c0_seq1.p1 gnl/MRDRNA2_/MRDRNA2_352687_c0~~gnl/MRDRNA2_/MRDRNA2_352687_c0_seq1.p1  ORF type:complete len:102 (-),score=15.62 gnl/MRDRNA2_/MRDRNA2_352687_c0_seq1:116-421(-)